MSTQISVRSLDGRAVVFKRGPAATAGRLRAEGERLRRAGHPGVVELLRSAPAEGGWELRMVHGGRPVEALDELTVPQAAALVAGLASTVADLHDLGVVHGRIDASHVLVGDHGRARLCGFGDGSEARGPEDDVAALGALLAALVGAEADGEPIPERRWRRRRHWSGWDRRGLLLLADQACADPATRRPSARRLAAAVAALVPSPPGPSASGWPPALQILPGPSVDPVAAVDAMASLRASALMGPTERRVRWPALVGAVAGVVVVAAGLDRWRGAPSAEGDRPIPAATPVSAEPAEVEPQQVAAPLPGGEVRVGGVRYRLGQPGDEVLIDDWDCDGSATPALLRPSTGEVFVFPRWITEGEQRVAAVLTVAGASDLVSAAPDGGCPTLSVRTRHGSRVPVTERRS